MLAVHHTLGQGQTSMMIYTFMLVVAQENGKHLKETIT